MELRQLRYFLAIVDSGSLSEAARKLGVGQPTLSHSLRALEKSLGASLFSRTKRGMALNAFGRTVETRARTISADADRAKAEIDALLGAQLGHINLASAGGFSQRILSKAVARFRETHPGVRLSIFEGLGEAVIPRVASGEFDYAFGRVQPARGYSDLALEVLLRQPVRVYSSARNPLTAKRRVTPREVWGEPWVLGIGGDHFRARVIALFAKVGLPPPKAFIEFVSSTTAKNILCDTRCVTALAEFVVAEEVAAGTIRPIHVPELDWEVELGVVYRRDVPLLPAARALLGEVRTVCQELGSKPRRPRRG